MEKIKKSIFSPAIITLVLVMLVSCQTNQKSNPKTEIKKMKSKHVEWSRNANIYEVANGNDPRVFALIEPGKSITPALKQAKAPANAEFVSPGIIAKSGNCSWIILSNSVIISEICDVGEFLFTLNQTSGLMSPSCS